MSLEEANAEFVRNDPLRDFFVLWDEIGLVEIEKYAKVLEQSKDERTLQQHLADNPLLLVQHLSGGAGRWVIPQKRLGSEFVPDFVLCERNSLGDFWTLVELQSPKSRFFTKKRRPSEHLDEGIRQVLEWRRWLAANRDYARRPRVEDGLGLRGIDAESPGLVLIGRQSGLVEQDKIQLRQLGRDHNISFHTYDWLIRRAKSRIAALARFHGDD